MRRKRMVVSVIRGIDVGGGFFQPTGQIVLNGPAWVTAILSAFCAEFEKDNPSASTPFTLEPPGINHTFNGVGSAIAPTDPSFQNASA